MGAAVRANFGPHFIYPIAPAQLPSGMKLRPMSERCPKPIAADVAEEKCMTDKAINKKTDEKILRAFKNIIRTETDFKNKLYEEFMSRHIEEIRTQREERRLSTNDLIISSKN